MNAIAAPQAKHALGKKDDAAPRIMIVDDVEINILTVQGYLKKAGYREFVTTTNPHDAIKTIHTHSPDVLLLDIQMPDISGLDIMRVLSAESSINHLPIIVLTADQSATTKQEALNLGAYDFLTKPIDPIDLVPRIRNALIQKKNHDVLTKRNSNLESELAARTAAVFASQQQLILSLTRAAEHRDNDSATHNIRVGRYTRLIAQALGHSKQQQVLLELAAQLHDVGKIGVPDAILAADNTVEPDEFMMAQKFFRADNVRTQQGKDYEKLKTHTTHGYDILRVDKSPLMTLASQIAWCHHERWNGTGYPRGLVGDRIPLEGRIVAIADVFDTLSQKRPFKVPIPRATCLSILGDHAGTLFDPHLVELFSQCSEAITAIQIEMTESYVPPTKRHFG